MKLRNKKTGEIIDNNGINFAEGNYKTYNSLTELNEEWEDVPEEPKEYWYISDFGYVFNHEINNKSVKSTIEEMKSIGNYFLSREEAELVVRKLKAWKRLKDKGFRFIEGWLDNNDDFIIKAKLGHVGLIDQPDVHLIFGGEDGE